LQASVDAFNKGTISRRNIYFDIGAVVPAAAFSDSFFAVLTAFRGKEWASGCVLACNIKVQLLKNQHCKSYIKANERMR
jgi:hypothetical protein